MLEPEKPVEPDPNNAQPLKDEKPGFGQDSAPDQDGLAPKSAPKD